MPFTGIEEKQLPWLKDLDKDTIAAIQGQIFPAETLVACKNGYLVETSLFKVWLFDGSSSFAACKSWEHTVPITKNPHTPSVQVKKSAKGGFVFGIDSDNLCSAEVKGQVYTLTPHPTPPKPGSKRGSSS